MAPADPFWFSTRAVTMYMGFLGLFVAYSMRIGFSVAVVEMVTTQISERPDSAECPSSGNSSTIVLKNINWNEQEVAMVVGSFYYGYSTNQFGAGWIATRYGGKWVFSIGILIESLICFIIPFVAPWSMAFLIFLRVITGFLEAGLYPAYAALVAQWSPILERGRFYSIAESGAILGIVFGSSIAGYLCHLNLLGGWPLVFYASGLMGLLYFIVYCFTIYSYPIEHPRLSSKELDYIQSSIVPALKMSSTPWLRIVTSLQFWAYVSGNFAAYWILSSMMTCLPIYLDQVLRFDITSNGLFTALPHFVTWLVIIIAAILSDHLVKKKLLSVTGIRKLNTFVGSFFPAIFLIAAGYVGCNKYLAIFFLVIATGFSGFITCGPAINPMDIAPSIAGTVYGIGNTFGAASGFIAPLIMSSIVKCNPHSSELWRLVFFVFGCVIMTCSCLFVLFASGDPQPWGYQSFQINEIILDNNNELSNIGSSA